MGKKRQRHDWPEAKKLCRLNQNDIAMAKSLGFRPDSLIRARPDPKQKWKLPVKYWIHELYFKRFGRVLGEKPASAPPPATVEYDEEAVRRYGEELYMEDYWDRNQDASAPEKRPRKSVPAAPSSAASTSAAADDSWLVEIDDRDCPF
jgi:hypothetical protein